MPENALNLPIQVTFRLAVTPKHQALATNYQPITKVSELFLGGESA
jgi:hypothetical protein